MLRVVLAIGGAIAGPEPASGTGDGVVDEAGERPRLLVLGDESELGHASVRAIKTELNDVPVALEIIELSHAVDLRDRIATAERLLAERDALAAVWIESSELGIDVYLVVREAGMVQRPIAIDEGQEAALEAAAVVVRRFSTDLLAGRAVGLRPENAQEPVPADARADVEADVVVDAPPELVDPDRRPPPRPTPWRLDARGRFRAQIAYVGQAYAPQQRWASGAELQLGYRARVGVHVGVGYALTEVFDEVIEHPTSSGVAEVTVRRHPAALVVGYQHAWARPRLALDAQLRGVVEVVQRRAADPVGGQQPVELDPSLVVVPGIEPRLQLDWLVLPPLAIQIGLGLRIHAIDYQHGLVLEDQDGNAIGTTYYLAPHVVTPTLVLGLGVFL